MGQSKVYRHCIGCGSKWNRREDLVRDRDLEITSYHASVTAPEDGVIILAHRRPDCGFATEVRIGDFKHYYAGIEYFERCTGEPGCPGYCLKEHELRVCEMHCELHWARVVLDYLCTHHIPEHVLLQRWEFDDQD